MTKRRLPAEWEKQSGIMLTWPQQESDWATNYQAATKTFIDIATQISHEELALIVCANEKHLSHVQQELGKSSATTANLRFVIAPSNDTWARDHGPITIFEENAPVLLDFIFNGWGNKYPSDRDNAITRTVYEAGVFGKYSIQQVAFVLEGGSIESDGRGTLLTTAHCLLSATRNPGFSKQEITNQLKQQLGTERILWLEHGALAGDDTDGHIDTLARFCNENTIAYVACDDSDDEHYAELTAMEGELKNFRQTNNSPYHLIRLPLPSAIYNEEGKRLPATYANFLIINHAVLVPTYNDNKDAEALATLATCFPGRKIIGIDCCALIQQYGSLHCVTMQLPNKILV
jgi:agmatine/peptidylarginine deiminase